MIVQHNMEIQWLFSRTEKFNGASAEQRNSMIVHQNRKTRYFCKTEKLINASGEQRNSMIVQQN